MKRFRKTARMLLLTSLTPGVVLITGCGGGTEQAASRLAPVPVKGSIIYKGKRLTGGTVRFEPEDGGREASGEIGPDGTFTVSTFGKDDGAVAGTHRLAIEPPAGRAKSLPAKFRSAASSKIVLEVSPGKTEYLVELK